MLLTELLYQRVKGLGAQGSIALKPGYVVVVSGVAALRHALLAAIYPGLDGERGLSDGSAGPIRIGVGVLPTSGVPSRVLRELGGDRQLQRVDAATNKFQTLTKDPIEIESFLRLECGLPVSDLYASFFTLDAAELPSLHGKPQAAEVAVDPKKVATLKTELQATRRYEDLQDHLFRISDKLLNLETLQGKLRALEGELGAIDAQRGKLQYTPEQQADILARASRLRDEEKKRDELLGKLALERRHLLDRTPLEPEPFLRSTLFSGGLAAGVLIDAIAVLLKRPSVALLGLAGFGAALVAVLRWIEGDEAGDVQEADLAELKEREEKIKKAFLDEMAPVRQAMRAADLDSVVDLVQLFRERGATDGKRQAVAVKLEQARKDPLNAELSEIDRLAADKQRLEAEVSQQGFARPLLQIESELKEAMGLTASGAKKAQVSDAEVPKSLFTQAAQALGTPAEGLASAVEARLAAYLSALTDKRIVTGRMDANGQLLLSTPDGRWGPYAGLPPPLRDLAYVSLRLALLERVAAVKKVPIVADDPFATLEAPKRTLIGRMLKAIAAQAQVIHRVAEAPPAGVADQVVKLA